MTKNLYRKCLGVFVMIGIQHSTSIISSTAQDLHYAQYFNAPLLVNPANTGFEPGADWRAGANYRNQWAGLLNNPYQTFGIWADAQVFNERFESGWAGAGGSISRDVAGSGNLSATRLMGSFAYHQLLGLGSLLSGGISIAAVNKRVDLAKLTFGNQWNGRFFDITIPSGENFNTSSVWYADVSLGLNYAYFPSERSYFNMGFSIGHLNRPNESFFSNTITDTKLAQRYTVFGNASLKLNDQWIVNPNAYFSSMAGSAEIVAGLNARYNLSGDGSQQLIGGVYYRNGDAIIPMIGYVLNNLELVASYDVTASSKLNLSQTRGAYEISIIHRGIFNMFSTSTKCPLVRF
jgi:type IX secretion system PorP/SprF family membrane protein